MRIEIDGVEYIPKSEAVFAINVTEESFGDSFGGIAIYNALKHRLASIGMAVSMPPYEDFKQLSFNAKVVMFNTILVACRMLDFRGDD